MKLPLSWLDDYMTLGDVSPKEYRDAMTMTGSMVEGYEEEGADIQNVKVGKIVKKVKHENADTLSVCTVDIGGETLQIVTGAPNVNEGDLIPLAVAPAHLPGNVVIKAGKLRGVLSQGMMCSHTELGLELSDVPGAAEDGVIVFKQPYAPGTDVREVLGLGGVTMEFEITSNRPDCLSVIGLARESAVTFGKAFNIPEVTVNEQCSADIKDEFGITVNAPDLCLRYSARLVKNVKIEPSPEWMQKRLRAAGVRAINNIVDITNYVMLEYGQPMHSFDTRFLEGREIVVRCAKQGETITTLDGGEHTLDDTMLVICDTARPVAVAGVMGGENSDIKDDTTEVLFESANFLRGSVRRTAKKLSLRTESSARFEKGLDAQNTIPALNRACQLVELLGAGEVCKGIIDINNSSCAPRILPFRPEWIRTFIGAEIDSDFMIKTLDALGFSVDVEKGEVLVPSWREDVEGEADIAEEVARIYGYDKIPTTPLRGETTRGGLTAAQQNALNIKTALTSCGYFEAISYSFISPKGFDWTFASESERVAVALLNPLGEDTSVMRTSMAPSMMELLSRNYKRNKSARIRLFEAGTVYIPKSLPLTELPYEKKRLALGAFGEMDFYDMKGTIEALLERISVKKFSFDTAARNPLYHPGKSADVYVNGKAVGAFGAVHPLVQKNYDIAVECFYCELDEDALIAAAGNAKKYKPPVKFPSLTRDISVVVEEAVKAAQIEGVIKKCGGNFCESIKLFDVYRGAQIGDGKKSVSYSVVYRAEDRTLNDEEINTIFDKTVKSLAEGLGATLR
ncbi:MAG: phenylalanine--tRNA ligase subunit beta [Clostridia bacterium]|nr:phenylalanine--tRNA ligase subunit beta [Clostridia bacterium]